MHMCDEYFINLIYAEWCWAGLEKKLAQRSFSAVNDWMSRMCVTCALSRDDGTNLTVTNLRHSDPSPAMFSTRLEQFLFTTGPPPLEVPRNVTDMFRGFAIFVLQASVVVCRKTSKLFSAPRQVGW